MPQPIADQLQSIPMSPDLSQSLGRAREFARVQAHRALLLEHLLLALTEDQDASGVLRACNVDLARLGTDVSGYLGGLLEDMRAAPGTEPGLDPELLRVLEAARQAAQQSRRRSIDGAIVLAAIVGDGKSPAAGLLKAHGMTFEEAIRTLQKASAQARSKQFAASAARTPPERPAVQEVEKEPVPPAPERPTPASTAAQPPPAGQSIDDMLAAARSRIQQRSTSVAGKPEAKPAAEPAPKAESETLPLMSLSSFTTTSVPTPPDLPPLMARLPGLSDPPGLPLAPEGLTPPLPSSERPPQMPLEPHPPSPPRAFLRANEGAPRPPPPPRGDRAQRADRPGAPELGPSWRQAANGALAGPRRPSGEATPPTRPNAATRPGQRAAPGPLMEAIPRRMRVGAAASAQVRISRDKIDGLMQLLMGGQAPQRPEAVVARVLSVRLKAPDGGFWIEAVTPEAQWIEMAPGTHEDEHVGWRWAVTPQRRGRHRLQLLVAARTVGRDGVAAETSPPDRTIEVTVRANRLRRVVRWIAFLVVFGLGSALGMLSQDKLGQDILDFGTSLFKNVLGLLSTSGFLPG